MVDCSIFHGNLIRTRTFIKGHRRMKFSVFIMDKKIGSCLAADDGAALHYKDGKLHTAVTFYEGAGAYEVSLKNGEVYHENITSINIG